MLGESWSKKGVSAANSAATFRIFAGSMGLIGGILGLIVDGKNIKETNNDTLKNILRLRFFFSIFLTVGQALSLFSAIASHSSKEILKVLSQRLATNTFAAILMSARVIAGLTLVSISLVALEIILKKCFLDDEMEDWCQKSAFRKANSNEKPFKSPDVEYEEFTKAIVSV